MAGPPFIPVDLAQCGREPSKGATIPSTRRPQTSHPAHSRPEQLVFALDPGRHRPHTTHPRLIPLVGVVEQGKLQHHRQYLSQQHTYQPTEWEEVTLRLILEDRAHQRLRNTHLTDDLLSELLEEGRLYLNQHFHQPLKQGDPREVDAHWERDPYGNQHAVFQCVPAARIMPLTTIWYVDPLALQMGPIETELQAHQIIHFMTLPAVKPEQVNKARQQLRNLAGHRLPPPLEVPTEEVQGVPTPRLVVSSREWSIGPIQAPVPLVTWSVHYGDHTVPVAVYRGTPPKSLPPIRITQPGQITLMQRDLQQELHFRFQLLDLGFHPIKTPTEEAQDFRFGPRDQFVPEHQWLHLLKHTLPDLRKQGWQIELSEGFPYRVVDSVLQAKVQDEEGWFTLDLGVEVDGQTVSLLPVLLEWMEQNPEQLQSLLDNEKEQQTEHLQVASNTFVQVELHRLRSILRLLKEFYAPRNEGEGLRLPRMAAGLLDDLPGHPDMQWQGGKEVLSLAKNIAQMGSRRLPKLPASLQAELRPYQHEGVRWLQLLRKSGCNGILADDMGLGKTLQTLAHLLIEKEAGRLKKPALIVAPTSLMRNWLSEAEKFTPSLKTLLLHGPTRHRHFDEIGKADVVFTTYALLTRDLSVLSGHTFHTIILDEAQYIKNHKNQTSQALKELSSKHRLCLTGTPLENHLGELWSLFHFLMPGLLPREAEFRQMFRNPIEKEGDPARQQRLSRMVRPLMLRRTKQQVAKELPRKTEITVKLELEGPQRDLYETLRVATQERLQKEIQARGLARSQIHVLGALLRLRQVCCDPRLLALEEARKVHSSVKLQWLSDTLPSMLEEGRTVLIFSQFTTQLALLGELLQELGIEYALLTGQTGDRSTPIQQFQGGAVKVFLISLKAGGVGLNLTAADTVIHYDPWWNPAAENQATDRAHRIGQDKPVFVYKLVTSGTIEEKILGMQRFKRALADSVLEGAMGEGLRLSEDDLRGLLGP